MSLLALFVQSVFRGDHIKIGHYIANLGSHGGLEVRRSSLDCLLGHVGVTKIFLLLTGKLQLFFGLLVKIVFPQKDLYSVILKRNNVTKC